LTTRGIDPNHARSLLIDSFCREMINRIPCDSFLQKMLRAIETFVTSGAS
jgi:Fe-S cluster assembly scaffold protein SufB